MPVNGIELKKGQKWKTRDYGIVTIVTPGLNEEYPWRFLQEDQEEPLSITDDGKYWSDDNFPILLELVKDVTMNSINKFNPQPGDKIICNNGEEFICCTQAFLSEGGLATYLSAENKIFAYRETNNKCYHKYDWMYWDDKGEAAWEEWNIREVIPQSSEASADKKEEPRYSMQEIKEALDASGWATATSSWGAFQKNLTKINSAEYQEYLRLKAIYE